MKKLNQRQLGYLEGIIDGEGTFGFYKHGKSNYRVHCSVANTDLKLLKKIKSLLIDGNICKRKKQKSTHKQGWEYKISQTTARVLFPKLKLISKEKQRLIILKVLKICAERKNGKGKWYPEYKTNQLNKYIKKLKDLKHG